MSQYRNSNLLYNVSISVWTARKKDKAETVKLNANAGAVDGAANVNKQLLPDNPELLAIHKCAGAIRTWVYENTLEWAKDWRIGQVVRHAEFCMQFGDKAAELESLFDTFTGKYAEAIEDAKFTLNAMFNSADYPGVEEMRNKFRISLDVMPMPNAEDFRVVDGLPQEEVDRLCAVAKKSVEDRVQAGMNEAYERLFGVISKLATTLTQYGDNEIKKFNDTLMGNIEDLVAVMPALNITNDAKLNALTSEAKQLLDYDLKDLRKDEGTRKAAIREAKLLAVKFGKIIGHEVVESKPLPTTATADLFADMLGD